MKKLALFGAGIANLALVKELEKLLKDTPDKLEIILIDPKDYIEIPFSMIRSLIENESLGKISRQKISKALKGITHIQRKLHTLKEHSAVLDNGQEITFDYAVIATGAHTRGFDELSPSYIDSLEDRNKLWNAKGQEIANAKTIIVAGGGVIGVELCGEILSAYPNKSVHLISGSNRLISHMDEKASKKALKVLNKLGKNFSTTFGDRVQYKEGMDTNNTKEITTESGKTHIADLVFLTMGNEYKTKFMFEKFQSVLNNKKQIKVNNYLQIQGQEHIFAIGDISDNSSVSLGHIAIDHGINTAHNIINLLNNKSLKTFKVGNKEKITFITIGKKHGIAQLPFGRLDFLIKMKQKDFFAPKILAHGKAR